VPDHRLEREPFVLAAIVGLIAIISGKVARKSHLAFGPYMLRAAVAAILASLLAGSHT
jgi:prepilin signal peptidase PulO-like enzyme (type II secretory pathway)